MTIRNLKNRICTVPECGRPHAGLGFCEGHRARFKKYGTPTGGSPLRHYGETKRSKAVLAFLEAAAICQDDNCLIWPFTKIAGGYPVIALAAERRRYAHRAVCEKVHGVAPTNKHEAAHSCGNGHMACVNGSHLRWATPSENNFERSEHGTMPRGVSHPAAKITEQDVIAIRTDIRKHKAIAADFGIDTSNVCLIKSGKAWRHVPFTKGG